MIILLLCVNAFADSNNVDRGYKSKNGSVIDEFMQCANQDSEACKLLLQHGITDSNLCEAHECSIIGATLSFANREDEAITYLKKACDLNITQSCTHLALIYQNQGLLNDSKSYYSIACNHADILACYNLGVLYANRDSQDYKPNHAIQAFQKACSAMYPKACFNIGILYATISKKQLPYAKLYFDKACDLGMEESCLKLEELNNANIPMPTPEKKRGLYNNKAMF